MATSTKNPPARRNAAARRQPTQDELNRSYKEIGERIAQIQREQNLTDDDVGRRAGFAPDTVKKVRQGASVKAWEKLGRYCRALGVTPNEVLGFDPIPRQRDRNILLSVFETMARFYGFPVDEAQELARILLQVVEEPLTVEATTDANLAAKIQVELQLRQFRRG